MTIVSFEFEKNIVDKRINLKISVRFFFLYVDDILLATNDFGFLHETRKFLYKCVRQVM